MRTDVVGWVGGLVAMSAVALHGWSSVSLALGERHGEAASAPVTDGAFGYVRNPIYLAGIALILGIGLIYHPWRPMDLGLPVILLLYFHAAVVLLEEPDLRRRFGATYDHYCARVPRWLPRLERHTPGPRV